MVVGVARSDSSQPMLIPPHPPQLSPGVYDEDTLVAGCIDWVLHRAEVHGMRVLVSMIENWRYFNSIDQVGVVCTHRHLAMT